MERENLLKHPQELCSYGERCRENLMSLLNNWPIGEMSWRIGLKIRTERDKQLIRTALWDAQHWVQAVARYHMFHDKRRMEDVLNRLMDILNRLTFAVLEQDFKENSIEEAGSAMDEAMSILTTISQEAAAPHNVVHVPAIQEGTAFIMMPISELPEIVDTYNTVKRVCGGFGLRAFRSDDIQHQGKIMDQILTNIKTAEVLIGDLTGENPNVYFEVACAHMINRDPILFRRYGTKLHFDLSSFNVPEYRSFLELENLLGKRLEALNYHRN